MDVNYELYKVFYFVGKTLSFSEASKQLYISQSAVSQSIKTLEKKLNQHLFIRSTKKVQMTPEGEMLFKHIEPAINLIIRGENSIMETHTLNGGQLRIGANDTICRYFLVPYLKKFHTKYPNIRIKVSNQPSFECVTLLENGNVDFIVTNFPNRNLKDNIQVININIFHDVFVAGTNYMHLKDKVISLEELQDFPLLMLDKNTSSSEYLHNYFQQHNLELIPEIELSSNDLLIDLARIGLGIAFVPNYSLTNLSDDLFIMQLKNPLPPRNLAISYSDEIPLSQSAKAFIRLITDKI